MSAEKKTEQKAARVQITGRIDKEKADKLDEYRWENRVEKNDLLDVIVTEFLANHPATPKV